MGSQLCQHRRIGGSRVARCHGCLRSETICRRCPICRIELCTACSNNVLAENSIPRFAHDASLVFRPASPAFQFQFAPLRRHRQDSMPIPSLLDGANARSEEVDTPGQSQHTSGYHNTSLGSILGSSIPSSSRSNEQSQAQTAVDLNLPHAAARLRRNVNRLENLNVKFQEGKEQVPSALQFQPSIHHP